jgi:hypothetical protein
VQPIFYIDVNEPSVSQETGEFQKAEFLHLHFFVSEYVSN